MREQVVETYEGKSPSDVVEILNDLILDNNRIVSVVRCFTREEGHPKSTYIVVYEKPYDD